MSLLRRSLTQRVLPFLLTLALPGISVSTRSDEAAPAAASPAQETASEHATHHQDPRYVCPMHPQVISAEPGKCPICGMDLVAKAAAVAEPDAPGGPTPNTTAPLPAASAPPPQPTPPAPAAPASAPASLPIAPATAPAATTPPAATAKAVEDLPTVVVAAAVVNQLGVRTAPVRRGALPRNVEGFGAFLRSTARGYRPPVYSNPAADPAVNPDDTGTVVVQPLLVQVQVFEREASLLREGQTARVRFPGLGAMEWKGTVTGLEGQVNTATHTLQFRVGIDSGSTTVPAGMTAVVTVEVDPVADALLVPREAVIVTGKGARVILARDHGRFQPRAVDAEDVGEDEMVIRSGLEEGEQVVVSAQFLLDSEANLQAGLRRLTGERPEGRGMSEGDAR